MNYFLTISCILGVWATLGLMGSQRAHLKLEMERRVRRGAAEARHGPAEPALASSTAGSPAAQRKN